MRIFAPRFACFLGSLLLVSCAGSTLTDPTEVYFKWTGKKATPELNLMNGEYRETGFKEYTLFLKLKPTIQWRDEFLKENELDPEDDPWSVPERAPSWFNPDAKCKLWKSPMPFAESIYLQDSVSGEMYIYEVD